MVKGERSRSGSFLQELDAWTTQPSISAERRHLYEGSLSSSNVLILILLIKEHLINLDTLYWWSYISEIRKCNDGKPCKIKIKIKMKFGLCNWHHLPGAEIGTSVSGPLRSSDSKAHIKRIKTGAAASSESNSKSLGIASVGGACKWMEMEKNEKTENGTKACCLC